MAFVEHPCVARRVWINRQQQRIAVINVRTKTIPEQRALRHNNEQGQHPSLHRLYHTCAVTGVAFTTGGAAARPAATTPTAAA